MWGGDGHRIRNMEEMLKARQRVYDAKKKQIFELSFDGELDEVRESLSLSLSFSL